MGTYSSSVSFAMSLTDSQLDGCRRQWSRGPEKIGLVAGWEQEFF